MGTQSLAVNGVANVQSDTGGGLEDFGVSVNGVTIHFDFKYKDIYTDTYGPDVPFDVQYMGFLCTVDIEFVYFDQDVLDEWRTGLPGSETELGDFGAIGTLMVANGNTGRLLIQSTPPGGLAGDMQAYNFPQAYMLPTSGNVGTVNTTWKASFRCLPDQQTESALASVFDASTD